MEWCSRPEDPSAASAQAFDPIAGSGACARVADQTVAGTVVWISRRRVARAIPCSAHPTVIADLTVTGTAANSMLAARLLDVDPDGNELLVSRGIYRPEASGPAGVPARADGFPHLADHHLQLELLGNEAPTMRASNVAFAIDVANVDVRIPVAEPQSPAARAEGSSAGLLPEPGFAALFASGSALAAMLARRRRAQ